MLSAYFLSDNTVYSVLYREGVMKVKVQKRDGRIVEYNADKITAAIKKRMLRWTIRKKSVTT